MLRRLNAKGTEAWHLKHIHVFAKNTYSVVICLGDCFSAHHSVPRWSNLSALFMDKFIACNDYFLLKNSSKAWSLGSNKKKTLPFSSENNVWDFKVQSSSIAHQDDFLYHSILTIKNYISTEALIVSSFRLLKNTRTEIMSLMSTLMHTLSSMVNPTKKPTLALPQNWRKTTVHAGREILVLEANVSHSLCPCRQRGHHTARTLYVHW